MKKAIAANILIIMVVAVIVIGLFATDQILRMYGLSLPELLGALKAVTSEILEEDIEAISFDELTEEQIATQIGKETYQKIKQDKEAIEESFAYSKAKVESINEDLEAVETMKKALGDKFSIYLFSTIKVNDVKFKVFEWLVRAENGKIVTFDKGTDRNADAMVFVDQSVAKSFTSGEMSTEQVAKWITEEKLKIRPVSAIAKATPLLPLIVKYAKA